MNHSEALANVFSGPVQPVRKSIFYRMGILLVTIVMVLLPCIYAWLMILVGFGTWWHATNNTLLLTQGRAGIMLYLGATLLGGVLLILMLKPLLAAPGRKPPVIELSADDEPRLFEHIRSLCRLLRAPMPRRISVDCQVNASAGFRRGWWSLLGNDLTLTIGLPLVTSMDLRQLTGVVAHELGHFAQGSGMKLSFVVRSINLWFARVVYGDDEIDRALAGAMKSSSRVVSVVVLVGTVRAGVWVTKKILWVLMLAGHAVSSFLMRQMEFDADRYEARVAGTETFNRTALQLAHIGVAFQAAQSDAAGLWREERMTSDLPGLVAEHFGKQPAELRAAVNEKVLSFHTELFNTHPSDRDRIASARRENAPGIVALDLPASVLFNDLPALSRKATLAWYQAILGSHITEAGMVDSGAIQQEKAEQFAAQDAVSRRLPIDILLLKPIFLRSNDLLNGNLTGLQARLEECRASIGDKATKARESLAISSKPEDPVIRREAYASVREAETERVRCALSILRSPEGMALQGDAGPGLDAEAGRLLECLEGLAGALDKFERLNGQASVLAQRLNTNPATLTDQDKGEILSYSGGIVSTLNDIRHKLESVVYPFAHARKAACAADTCLAITPDGRNPFECLKKAEYAVNGFVQLYIRTLGRLVILADGVESALGMEPLPVASGPGAPAAPPAPIT